MKYYEVSEGQIKETSQQTGLYTEVIEFKNVDGASIDAESFVGDLDDARALGGFVKCTCAKEAGKCTHTLTQNCHSNNETTCLDGLKSNCKP